MVLGSVTHGLGRRLYQKQTVHFDRFVNRNWLQLSLDTDAIRIALGGSQSYENRDKHLG